MSNYKVVIKGEQKLMKFIVKLKIIKEITVCIEKDKYNIFAEIFSLSF